MPVTPLRFAIDLIDRAELLAERAGQPPEYKWTVESDMLRSAWAFVGTAIDTYFHERVRRALTTEPMSADATKYKIQLGPVEEMIDRFLKDRAKSRPRVVLKNILHDALLRDTFQGSTNIERAFSLIGAGKPWANLSTALQETPTEIKARLDRQYARRNQIAHEGDYRRQERPQTMWYEPITRNEVDDECAWTRGFLGGADLIT